MEARKIFREEQAAAKRLVESVEGLFEKGLPLGYLSKEMRRLYHDAQITRPGDGPIPTYYKR